MTEDEAEGMAWFNALTPEERRHWLDLVGTGKAVDAWTAFKAAGVSDQDTESRNPKAEG